jgi:ECF sigma factor
MGPPVPQLSSTARPCVCVRIAARDEHMTEDPGAVAPERISQLLADWANRDAAARDALVPIVYEELRRLAHHYMRGERVGHTLQTTALVNEVYVRLSGYSSERSNATPPIFRRTWQRPAAPMHSCGPRSSGCSPRVFMPAPSWKRRRRCSSTNHAAGVISVAAS